MTHAVVHIVQYHWRLDIYYVQALKVKDALNAKCFSNPDVAACSLNVFPGSAEVY